MVTFRRAAGIESGLTATAARSICSRRWSRGGFPVLIENVYYDGPGAFKDWMAHNRIIMGYDDDKQELYSFDSLLGNGRGSSGTPDPLRRH